MKKYLLLTSMILSSLVGQSQSQASSFSESIIGFCSGYLLVEQTIGGQSPFSGEIFETKSLVLVSSKDSSEEYALKMVIKTSDSTVYEGYSDRDGKLVLSHNRTKFVLERPDLGEDTEAECLILDK